MTSDKFTETEIKELENRIRILEIRMYEINRNIFYSNNKNSYNSFRMQNSQFNPYSDRLNEFHNNYFNPQPFTVNRQNNNPLDQSTDGYSGMINGMFNIPTEESSRCFEVMKTIESTHTFLEKISFSNITMLLYVRNILNHSVDIVIILIIDNKPVMYFNKNLFNYKLITTEDGYELMKINSVE